MIYCSKSNPLIKDTAALKEKKYRDRSGVYVAEGVKMVNEAISAKKPIVKIFTTEACELKINPSLAETAIVSPEVFSYISDAVTPQGALAVIRRDENAIKPPVGNSLLLDGIRDPGNLGTIFRTAAACGFNDIYLCGCCDAYNPKVIRSSMSGIYFCRLYECSLSDAFSCLDKTIVYAADMGGDNVFGLIPPQKICLSIGNEADGISDEVRRRADKIVGIPMETGVESLNAAVSCAVLMYQLKFSKGV